MSNEEKPKPEMSAKDWVGFTVVILVLGVAAAMAVIDHWQWMLIIPIGSAIAFGLIKFGWDATTAVEKKAKK
ncbi:MAG: hypothetical protein HLX51_11680 [Micrococcaceae bacterium]|nr:hypothetical protein [Micrococcaceae bacterium]